MRSGYYWVLLEGDHCSGRSNCSFGQRGKRQDLLGSHKQRVGGVHYSHSSVDAESLAFREQAGMTGIADLYLWAGHLQAFVHG